jgi:hypothetical protein
MGRKGKVLFDRKILDWEWYTNVNTFRVFFHIVMNANFKAGRYEGKEIKRGQWMTSIKHIGEKLKLSDSQVKTALNHLKMTNTIATEGLSKNTIITVINYDDYQSLTKKIANKSPTNRQQISNKSPQYKNVKNDKNVKNERGNALTFGKFKNVFLFQEEYDELARKYPLHYRAKIERLSSYIASSGRVYDNHFAKLLEWLSEDTAKENSGSTTSNASYDIDELENNLDIR